MCNMSINPLKEFFKRRKAEAKFAMAGPGKTLSSNEAGPSSGHASSARQAAAEAAMKRFSKDNNKPTQRPRMTPMATSDVNTKSASREAQHTGSDHASISRTEHRELPIIDGVPQRNVQIYTTEQMAQRMKCPDLDEDFFRLTVEDAKLIQQRYDEERAKNEVLKTREMRRREAEVKKPSTNIARLRFKLPNDFILEASFSGSETMGYIRDWLAVTCLDKMELEMKNFDILMGLKPFKGSDFDKTVRQLSLIPATTLTIVGRFA